MTDNVDGCGWDKLCENPKDYEACSLDEEGVSIWTCRNKVIADPKSQALETISIDEAVPEGWSDKFADIYNALKAGDNYEKFRNSNTRLCRGPEEDDTWYNCRKTFTPGEYLQDIFLGAAIFVAGGFVLLLGVAFISDLFSKRPPPGPQSGPGNPDSPKVDPQPTYSNKRIVLPEGVEKIISGERQRLKGPQVCRDPNPPIVSENELVSDPTEYIPSPEPDFWKITGYLIGGTILMLAGSRLSSAPSMSPAGFLFYQDVESESFNQSDL